MRILLAGFGGFVGEIIRKGIGDKYQFFYLSDACKNDDTHFQCDLRDANAVNHVASKISPEIVIHAAGNKDIKYCESHPDDAYRINCSSVTNIANAFSNTCRIIYISTDYVFDGKRGHYTEDEMPDPCTVYGKSKRCAELEGERLTDDNFVILRASALFNQNASFPRYLHDNLSKGNPIECYSDVFYSPTYYKDFLRILDKLIHFNKDGPHIFHSCGDRMSRCDFAVCYAKALGFDTNLVSASSGIDNELFLFPDLSMNNAKTKSCLHVETTTIHDALSEIESGSPCETAQSI